jgi:hypothetical protein
LLLNINIYIFNNDNILQQQKSRLLQQFVIAYFVLNHPIKNRRPGEAMESIYKREKVLIKNILLPSLYLSLVSTGKNWKRK